MPRWARRREALDKLATPEPQLMTPEEINSLIERTKLRMEEAKQKALRRAGAESSAKRKRARQAHTRYLLRKVRLNELDNQGAPGRISETT